jgi:hypothetical protein
MKVPKLIKTKWIVLLCLFAPLLSFIFIKPDWLARLVAVNGYSLALTILVFIYGLNPKSHMLGKPGHYSEHKDLDRKKKKTAYFMRGLVILFGIFYVCSVIRPLIYDDIQFARQGLAYAKNVDGSLAGDNDTIRGMFFLYQSLLIRKDGQQMGDRCSALFFTRFVYSGRKYHFIIAPKSGVVLDFQEISTQ